MKTMKTVLAALFFFSFTGNLLSNNTVDIVLASTSKIKVSAVKNVFSKYKVNIFTIESNSAVNIQPVNAETYTGALNRIKDAKNKYLLKNRKNSFIIIAIENGIFSGQKDISDAWSDKAVIAMETSCGKKYQDTTDSLAFPNEYIDITKERGFENTTVGKVMSELKFIHQHDDPHSSLSNKSRRQYLEEALVRLANILKKENIIETKCSSLNLTQQ